MIIGDKERKMLIVHPRLFFFKSIYSMIANIILRKIEEDSVLIDDIRFHGVRNLIK